jgi:dolichol-phosphate mannosyltransferase
VVVIPTYNEAESICPIVQAVLDLPSLARVLVVDDGSPDGTATLVEREFPPSRVEVLRRTSKDGLGRAYAAGFARALHDGADVVVQMDADGSHAPADVERLVAAVADADVAIGSRYVPGGRVEGWPWSRTMLSGIGNRYAQLWLRTGVRDLTAGFKAWRADMLRRLDYAAPDSRGYAFQIEMTARALAAGARIVEVPVVFRDRERGESKMSFDVVGEALWKVPQLRRLRVPGRG